MGVDTSIVMITQGFDDNSVARIPYTFGIHTAKIILCQWAPLIGVLNSGNINYELALCLSWRYASLSPRRHCVFSPGNESRGTMP